MKVEGKNCSRCGEWKPLKEYSKSGKLKNGEWCLRADCKTCKNAYQRELKAKNPEYAKNQKKANREWYEENREYALKKRKKYVQENIEKIKQYYQSDEYKASKKKYQQSEKGKAKEKEYQQTNKRKSYLKNWQMKFRKSDKYQEWLSSEKGREKIFKANIKRRSYEHKVCFKPFERKEILDRDNWTCCNCGIKVHDRSTGDWNTPDKAHIDHIIPLSKGGNSDPSNLQTLCRTCNISKHDKVELQLSLF